MLKEWKTEDSRNKVQQLQWKKQGKEQDHVKDGGTSFKGIEISPPPQCPHMSLWTSWSSLLGMAEV